MKRIQKDKTTRYELLKSRVDVFEMTGFDGK